MNDDKMLSNPNEKKPFEPPPMRINEETARYLWNLAQKSNLTVTTATMHVEQTNTFPNKKHDPFDGMQRTTLSGAANRTTDAKGPATTNMKHSQMLQKKTNATTLNPFAALPLSLIKNGILSVTSDSACVEIENGVPILKENTEATMHCSTEQKSVITIEAVPMKVKSHPPPPPTTQPQLLPPPLPVPKEKTALPAAVRQASCEQPKIPSIENPIIAAQFQRKMLMQNQVLKELFKHDGVRPLASNALIPNSNQMEFAALLGLEIVTGFCVNEHTLTPKLTKPVVCAQCNTDFSPRWHSGGSKSLQQLCERCFIWHMRLKNTEERTKRYQAETKTLQKGLKLQPPKTNVPMQPLDPEECFKNYLLILTATGANCYDSNFGFSDLTKLGASIAANSDIVKAMDNLRSLNNTATPEARAKAIQNLQLAFYKGLSTILKTAENKMQEQQESMLRCYQTIVAQLAQKSCLTHGSSSQSTQRRTGAPLESFERAIKEHKQRLLKTIQNKN